MTEPRQRAYEILQAIEDGKRWSLPSTGDRDEAFLRTLLHGVIRWRLTLDHLISHLSGREIAKIDQPVLTILRLGIYQLHWTRVPDHAAVNESVDLAKRQAPRGRNFVNAILRKATRADLSGLIPAGPDVSSLSIRTSHPEWLLERWISTFGSERAAAIAAADQQPSYPDLLVDTRHISIDSVRDRLAALEISSEVSTLVPDMLRVQGSTSSLSDLIELGHVWPMDEGSAVVALIAGENSEVLDFAAAPGGKSLALIRRGSRVVSNDLSLERLQPLARLRRSGGDPRIRPVASDGEQPPFRQRFPVVLLDAPCSASGIIRKHPEIKWRLSQQIIDRSADLQRRLLNNALDLAANRVVYATCSLEREENDRVIQSVLTTRDDFELGDVTSSLPPHLHSFVSRGVLRLTPDSGTDGFTAFLLNRT
ncbi:MAG: hypothetical protein KY432_03250 [Acidobacteria bacterium]|nr:hypothetical protein [Acidobacteriota bacterium]